MLRSLQILMSMTARCGRTPGNASVTSSKRTGT
jgi:hypothetical protein